MLIQPKWILIVALFHLALGLGWLAGYGLQEPTVRLYEELMADSSTPGETLYPEGLNEARAICLQRYGCPAPSSIPPLPVISLHRDSAAESFTQYPPAPMDYTVLLRRLYEQGAQDVYLCAPLVWSDVPDVIVQSALGYELERFTRSYIGSSFKESPREDAVPETWLPYEIKPEQISGSTEHFPRADQLFGESPYIRTSVPRLAQTVVNNDLFTRRGSSDTSYPLFVRKGQRVFPTVTLAAALNALKMTVRDVKLIPGTMLYLGNRHRIALDEYGRIPLSKQSFPTVINTGNVIVPLSPILRRTETTLTQKLLAAAPAVIVSEPASDTNTPDEQALTMARSIRSILGSDAPLGRISLPVLPDWVELILVLDVILISLWAMRFRTPGRFITWGSCLVASLALSSYLFYGLHYWHALSIAPVSIMVIALAALFYPPFSPRSMVSVEEDEPGEAEQEIAEDAEVTDAEQETEGIRTVIPPETRYSEPAEVPIPHQSPTQTPPPES